MDTSTLLLGLLFSFFATAIPTALWTRLVWWCDRYEREPLPLLTAAFLWGAIPAVILAVVAEGIFGVPFGGLGNELVSDVISSGGIAPVVEELAKGAALLLILLLWPGEFDDVLDGILYGALIGFGFGMTENVFYFLGALDQGGWGNWGIVVLMRSVLFGLNHAFFTAFTGAGLGYARMATGRFGRRTVPLIGLAAAIVAHAIHNLGASLTSAAPAAFLVSLFSDGSGVLLVAVMIGLALRQERGWIRAELQAAVGRLLTVQEYDRLLSTGGRARQLAEARRGGGWPAVRAASRWQNTMTELAFTLHRVRVQGQDGLLARRLGQLESRLAVARAAAGWGEVDVAEG
ncbi:MAG: PrsW family intramembrane metalloprotease [Chloroflexi bacterium]|nr:PrsW family intramembrane metalloprotease [Chloroflexota bacterium]